MKFPLVRELAAEGIPVAVTYGVAGFSRQAYYQWLIELLGTDDRLDERIGERVCKTKSTGELRGVDFAFRLARRAGFVKVRKGAVSVTKRGTQLGRDPLADWRRPSRGCSISASSSTTPPTPPGSTPTGRSSSTGKVPGLLAHLLAARDPVPLVELQERLWQLVEASFVLDDLDQDQLRRHREHTRPRRRRICQAFADLGAVEVTEVETVTTVYGHEREHGGRVALTPLGAAAVRQPNQP